MTEAQQNLHLAIDALTRKNKPLALSYIQIAARHLQVAVEVA